MDAAPYLKSGTVSPLTMAIKIMYAIGIPGFLAALC